MLSSRDSCFKVACVWQFDDCRGYSPLAALGLHRWVFRYLVHWPMGSSWALQCAGCPRVAFSRAAGEGSGTAGGSQRCVLYPHVGLGRPPEIMIVMGPLGTGVHEWSCSRIVMGAELVVCRHNPAARPVGPIAVRPDPHSKPHRMCPSCSPLHISPLLPHHPRLNPRTYAAAFLVPGI